MRGLTALGDHLAGAIIAELDAADLPIDRVLYGPCLGAAGCVTAALDHGTHTARHG